MKALFLPTIKEGKLDFGSEYNEMRWNEYLKTHEGKRIKISNIDNPVSDEMRGYMFGAVLPFLRQVDKGAWSQLSDDQLYEVLKKNFNYFEAYNPLTKRVERYGQSVMSTSCKNQKAADFIARISDWVMENYGQTMPSSEDYKRWRDSAPLKDEEYIKNAT